MPDHTRWDSIHFFPVLTGQGWYPPSLLRQSSSWEDANYMYVPYTGTRFSLLQIDRSDPFNVSKAILAKTAGATNTWPRRIMGLHIYNNYIYVSCVMGVFPNDYNYVLVIDPSTWNVIAEKRIATSMAIWLQSAHGVGNKLYGFYDDGTHPILTLNLDTWVFDDQCDLQRNGVNIAHWNKMFQASDHGVHGKALYVKTYDTVNDEIFLARLDSSMAVEAYLALPYTGGADGYTIATWDVDEDFVYACGEIKEGGVTRSALFKLNRLDLSVAKAIKFTAAGDSLYYLMAGINKIVITGGYPITGIWTFDKNLNMLTADGNVSQCISHSPQTGNIPAAVAFLDGAAEEELLIMNLLGGKGPYFVKFKVTEKPWCTNRITVPWNQYSTMAEEPYRAYTEVVVTPSASVLTSVTSAFVLGVSNTAQVLSPVDTEVPTPLKTDDCHRFWPPVVVPSFPINKAYALSREEL